MADAHSKNTIASNVRSKTCLERAKSDELGKLADAQKVHRVKERRPRTNAEISGGVGRERKKSYPLMSIKPKKAEN